MLANHSEPVVFLIPAHCDILGEASMNCTNVTDGSLCLLQKVLIGAVLTVLIVVTVCGNVMVCLAVYLSRRLRSLTNCFIVSLAFTDLLLGLLVLPFSALYEITSHEWLLSIAFCNVYVSLDVMLCTASILNLFIISLDRYYAITAPLRYSTVVTPLRVVIALILIWVVSLMVSFLPINFGWNTNDTTIQNQNQLNGKQECKLEVNATYVLVDGLTMLPTVKEHKATVTLAAVMGAFIICWFPYFTVFTYRGVTGAVCDPLLTVVMWLGYANSALNPILYAALNRDFRTAYQRLLKCRQIRPDARETSLSHEMRDKTCNLMTNVYENKLLETHTMNGKAKPLIKETIER
uniref:Histamine receptor H2 n=1 Tax=Naja naja TaxID=35670 RepID=A0A8C6X847_NAJNA